ncbi:hypothetical protein, partial [Escherichia coli]|uniref:hypothetical protein n=1 Tax=Escherichia coli TaxID=562 RepID=UPI001AD90346
MQITSANPRKANKQKGNHYELMKKRLKTKETNKGDVSFKDYLSDWEESDTDGEKLTTPISVPSHYKKYTVEE